MTTHYVPTSAQYLAAIQVIIDNRRHAQNVVRFQKVRAFFFICIAMIATIAAATHTKKIDSRFPVEFSASLASVILPGLILVSTPIALWPISATFPGTSSRNSSWHLGLGQGEAASLASIVALESDALRRELNQVDLHRLVTGFICILCMFQFVAAGIMILIR